MFTFDMAMQVWPPKTCDITITVRAIVSEQQDGVLKDVEVLIFYPQVIVRTIKVRVGKFLVSLCGTVGEYNKIGLGL